MQIFKYFSLPLEFGMMVIAGVFLGYFLDGQWQTGFIFTLLGSIFGLAIGHSTATDKVKKSQIFLN